MKQLISKQVMLIAALMLFATAAVGEIIVYDRNIDYAGYIKYDRFLDVEIWTDNDEYYQGENIVISFQANRDCFVAIYNIDTQGRINLIFPTNPGENGWIEGGEVYQIPSPYDAYDLTVRGPEGMEFLQIVASGNPFVIPDWYDGSGLVADDDPYDYIDFINASYFQGDRNLKRAFDMTSFVVKEWNDYYFRPVHVYHHNRPYWDWDWGYYGSVYVDYPWGATIYIDGIYWGIAPLFIPRIYYGYHWVTVYDSYGYCWEDQVSVVRRKSIVLDRTAINPRNEVKSRFKEVLKKGYLPPAKNGYPEYEKEIRVKQSYKPTAAKTVAGEKYKMAQETKVTSRYTRTTKTSAGSVTKSKGNNTVKGSDKYKTTKSTSETKSTYNGGKSKQSGQSTDKYKSNTSEKSGSDGKTSKTYKSRKSGSSGKSSSSGKTYKSGKSGSSSKSSSSGKSYESGKSSSGKESSGSNKSSKSSSSSSSKKSSSKTTSSADKVSKKGR